MRDRASIERRRTQLVGDLLALGKAIAARPETEEGHQVVGRLVTRMAHSLIDLGQVDPALSSLLQPIQPTILDLPSVADLFTFDPSAEPEDLDLPPLPLDPRD